MLLPLPPLDDRELTDGERAAVTARVSELAEFRYRTAARGGRLDPLQHVVHLVLTRSIPTGTSGPTGTSAFGLSHELTQRWGSWDALRAAPDDVLAGELKAAGLPPQRTRRLRLLLDAAHTLSVERGVAGTTLAWLRTQKLAAVLECLGNLPGVTPADVAPLAKLITTSPSQLSGVQRVLGRLDLAGPDPSGVASGVAGAGTVATNDLLELNLLQHSRAVCHAKQPQCNHCPLISFCATGRSQDHGDDRPVAVELFAGGGGMGEGFDRAGFDIALAVEIDRDAAQTYRFNHPGTVVLEADATAVTGSDLRWLVPRADEVTAIVAGPPCQGYSSAGKRQAADERNNLYTAVVKIAADLKPQFVVIENVPGMRRVGGESYVQVVLDALGEADYSAKEHILRACDYGVPQLRRRMLFLAQRAGDGGPPPAPAPSHCAGLRCTTCVPSRGISCGKPAAQNVLDALQGLPSLSHGQVLEYKPGEQGAVALTNATTMAHSQRVIDKIADITAGSGPISYRRLHADLARTIVAGHRALPVHPTMNRTISVREAARIQGFEDTHIFAGSRSKQPLQVANAVPPAMAQAVAQGLIAMLVRQAGDAAGAPVTELGSRDALVRGTGGNDFLGNDFLRDGVLFEVAVG